MTLSIQWRDRLFSNQNYGPSHLESKIFLKSLLTFLLIKNENRMKNNMYDAITLFSTSALLKLAKSVITVPWKNTGGISKVQCF